MREFRGIVRVGNQKQRCSGWDSKSANTPGVWQYHADEAASCHR
jgi:hypothetical protein